MRLATSELHIKWSEMEHTAHLESSGGQVAGDSLNFEPLPSDQAAAPAAAAVRLSINENALLLGGLSCPARLPLRVVQLADFACITKLTFTEIQGINELDLAMFMPLEGLEAVTISACPSLSTVVINTAVWDGGARWNLQQLDLSKNPVLKSLPLQAIAEMPSVRELACSSCPNLWSPPQEIAAQGGKECMDFVRVFLKDGAVNTRMTLFLLGDGEAGKTSLFRALKSSNNVAPWIREDMRTVGIDTEDWRPQAGEGRFLSRATTPEQESILRDMIDSWK